MVGTTTSRVWPSRLSFGSNRNVRTSQKFSASLMTPRHVLKANVSSSPYLIRNLDEQGFAVEL